MCVRVAMATGQGVQPSQAAADALKYMWNRTKGRGGVIVISPFEYTCTTIHMHNHAHAQPCTRRCFLFRDTTIARIGNVFSVLGWTSRLAFLRLSSRPPSRLRVVCFHCLSYSCLHLMCCIIAGEYKKMAHIMKRLTVQNDVA